MAWAGLVTALRGRRPADPADLAGAVAGLLAAGGVPSPWVLLAGAGVLLAGALALLGLAFWGSGPRQPEPRRGPVGALESSHAA